MIKAENQRFGVLRMNAIPESVREIINTELFLFNLMFLLCVWQQRLLVSAAEYAWCIFNNATTEIEKLK